MKNTSEVSQGTKPILLLIDSETKTATRVVDGKLEQQVLVDFDTPHRQLKTELEFFRKNGLEE